MKTWKLTLVAIIAAAAFAGQASAITSISINDSYIGGNPGGGSESGSWDGKDVVGDAAFFGIDNMKIAFNGSSLSSISIFTNYVDYLGKYDTHLGDLFISTNGYITPGTHDTNISGEQWEYALVLNSSAEVHDKAFRGTNGTIDLYKIINNSSSDTNIVLSHASGTFRNYQEVEINTGKGGLQLANAGRWAINNETNELLFDLTTDYFSTFSDYGFHWGMSCGNDVIEGGASAPVPEPSTFVLLGAGLLGAVLVRRRTRK